MSARLNAAEAGIAVDGGTEGVLDAVKIQVRCPYTHLCLTSVILTRVFNAG